MILHPWNEAVWQRLLHLRDTLPHSLLFHGRAGIGKLALAEQLAELVLCENPQAEGQAACGVCPSCHWQRQGSHPDFMKLQPAMLDENELQVDPSERKSAQSGQKISVAQVRELTRFVQLSAHRGGLRVALIHPAEAMNAAAANALLKTLEEPPPNTLLILVSHQSSRLLPTILSRCHQIRFTLPDADVAESWLAQQGIREANVCLAQAGGAPLLASTLADADYQERRQGFLTGLSRMNAADALLGAEQHAKQPLPDMVHWLQQWLHDLVSLQLTGRIYYQIDFEQELRGMAERANLLKMLDFQRRLQAARASVQHPLAVQMVLEDLLLGYAGLFD
ncbi:MAG: DNA polymerase III subunit delta' [Pseudomonadota bacterium]